MPVSACFAFSGERCAGGLTSHCVPKLPQKFSAKNDGNVKLFRAPKAGTRVASGGMPHEDVLGGIHLRHEFFDMKVDMTIFVEESTATGKQLASKTPLLIFGQAGSAKSSISNATRCKVAGADLLDPFPVSDHGRGTSGIDFRSVQTDDWATSGCRETLVFFDTQGWELKDKKGGMKLMEMAIKKAIEQGIPEDVLRCRMICVLVIDCTKPRDVEQDEFLELVKSVCEGSKKLAEGCDVVLVPVFSKADALSPEKRLAFKGHAEGHLKKAIRHTVRVEEAIFVSLGRSEQDRDAAARGRKMTDGSLDGIDTLIAKLKSISREQLNSRGILDQVRKHVHTDCQTYLKKVAEAGLESEHALARRLVWADARALCLQVGNMYEALPLTCWKDSDHLFKKMQRLPTNTPTAPDDGWHVDPVRKYMRQWPRLCPHECPSDSHVSNVATETARQTPVQQLREDIPRNDIPRDDIPRDEEATMGAVRVASLAEARKQSHASESTSDSRTPSASTESIDASPNGQGTRVSAPPSHLASESVSVGDIQLTLCSSFDIFSASDADTDKTSDESPAVSAPSGPLRPQRHCAGITTKDRIATKCEVDSFVAMGQNSTFGKMARGGLTCLF